MRPAGGGGELAQAGLGAPQRLVLAVPADMQPGHSQVVPVPESVVVQGAMLECVQEASTDQP
jgi:hypothetical protein